jgi:hypothetical protein
MSKETIDSFERLDTPSLLLDLDKMECNRLPHLLPSMGYIGAAHKDSQMYRNR